MAAHRPFLLLAILVVCSSQRPSLQRRTDERFRRVLSESHRSRGEEPGLCPGSIGIYCMVIRPCYWKDAYIF